MPRVHWMTLFRELPVWVQLSSTSCGYCLPPVQCGSSAGGFPLCWTAQHILVLSTVHIPGIRIEFCTQTFFWQICLWWEILGVDLLPFCLVRRYRGCGESADSPTGCNKCAVAIVGPVSSLSTFPHLMLLPRLLSRFMGQ